jgi:hypothetical protein
MSKAKTFGGVGVIIGIVLIALAYVLVPGSFLSWVLQTFLPIVLVVIALLAIIVGIMLLIYG